MITRIFITYFIFTSMMVYGQNSNAILSKYNLLSKKIKDNMEVLPDSVVKWTGIQKVLASELKNDSLFINAQLSEAEALFNIGIYDECLKLRYQILAVLEKQKQDKRIAELTLKIGWVYFEEQDYVRYIHFAEKAKTLYKKINSPIDTINCNTEIGLGLVMKGDTQKGIALLIQSKDLSKKHLKDSFQISLAVDNLSLAYSAIGQHHKALQHQLEAENYRFVDYPIYYEVASYSHLAEKYLAIKDYINAQYYSNLAIKFAKIYNNATWLFHIYYTQAQIYEEQNRYKEALQYFHLASDYNDTVRSKDYNAKMSIMATRYELEQKQNKIALLSKDKKIAKNKLQLLSFGLVAIILSSVLILLSFRNKQQAKDKFQKEVFAKQVLNAQEEERQRIAKDLHDSVGQNILFIKNQLQSPKRDDKALEKSIDIALEEVRNISKDLYPNQLEKYGLASAVQALSEQVNQSTGIFVSSDMQGIDAALSKNAQINFYRIIQEFVNNTLKHANASAIRITTQQTPTEIKLIVQDNGKGFNKADLQTKANTSFGMLNMEERIKMLKGKVEIESEIGKGTKSIFSVPI